MGFEPMNRGFADLRVEPLHHVAKGRFVGPCPVDGCPSRIRTSVHGSKVRCPTARRRGSGAFEARMWSGRRDSNPRPSPWQGDALPTEPLPLGSTPTCNGGAEGQNRTGDTAIFSRVLYRLSYLGPMANRVGCPSADRRIPRPFAGVPWGRWGRRVSRHAPDSPTPVRPSNRPRPIPAVERRSAPGVG